VVYGRDPTHVTFEPRKIQVNDPKSSTTVPLSDPGAYTYVDDGILVAAKDVTVGVLPRSPPEGTRGHCGR
jgi:hypothetical protein